MFDSIDSLFGFFRTYTGGVFAVFALCTMMAATVTQIVRDVERKLRLRAGRSKHPFWNHTLRAISTTVGLATAPVARFALSEIPTGAEVGSGASDASGGILSPFTACFVGFAAGFFLAASVWALKAVVRKWSPEAADRIPDVDPETEPLPFPVDAGDSINPQTPEAGEVQRPSGQEAGNE